MTKRATSARLDADTIVVGAGVFGAWTAARLRAEGRSVMLLDAWGPAHSRRLLRRRIPDDARRLWRR